MSPVMIARAARLSAAAVMVSAIAAQPARAQDAPTLAQAQAQADRGADAYAAHCAVCHGPDLTGGPFGPPLSGDGFQARWGGVTLSDLATYLHNSMPPAAPGGLDDGVYADLIAFQMARNGMAAGAAAELALDDPRLAEMTTPGARTGDGAPPAPSFASLSSRHAAPYWPAAADPLADLAPVTQAMLSDPPAESWLSWRRSHLGQGFSPLDGITADNVGRLRLEWSLALPPGPNMAEPLVHEGVLYAFAYGDEVLALNAADGTLLWRYQRRLPQGVTLDSRKTMALYEDLLFVATSDAHLVALDARTGRPVWDRAVADGPGYRITGGPLAADGVVMQGLAGRAPGGNPIVGLDARTGERLWSFNTIAAPGTPDDSWNGLPMEARNGGSVWTSGTYDSQTGLAYFGPAPTYDTGPLRHRGEGERNDALYTDATVALAPRTGALVWHYQHMQNDQWDMDWAFERVIADMQIDGASRRVVVTSGKEGLFDILDARTGDYLTTHDMGWQNFVTGVDPATGRKTVDPAMLPGGRDDVFTLCPYGGGGRNWMGTAFDARTSLLYVVAQDVCTDVVPVEGGGGFLSTGVNMEMAPRPDSDGRFGLVQAMDLRTGETVWRARQRAPQTTGVLATAGGVVFAGALDRKVTAYDAATGDALWRAGVSDTPNAAPISYAVNGRQYVAVIVGHGNPVTTAFTALAPEITIPPVRSSAIYVFALPPE